MVDTFNCIISTVVDALCTGYLNITYKKIVCDFLKPVSPSAWAMEIECDHNYTTIKKNFNTETMHK